MSIQLVTYANQTVTPTNDAIIYERAIDQNGIFYGCNVTVSSNNVNITGGYGIICGREFTIQSESIAVTLAPSGTLDGRLYVRLDLADADAPIQLLTATGNTLPPLEQDDDVNYTNGTWEMELATFTVGVSALSDVVETYETIIGTNAKVETALQPECITAKMSSAQTLSSTNVTVCNINTVDTFAGTKLSLNSSTHEIKIGSGVNYVEVQGCVYFTGSSANKINNAYIYKNSTEIATGLMNLTANYYTVNTPTVVVPVTENDVITLRAKTGTASTSLGENSTRIFVKVIG